MPSTAPITGGRVLVSRTGESTTGSQSRWTWGRWVRLEALQDVVGGWVVISCCCLIAKSCLTVCDPMDHSTLDFPDLHHLLEFAQTHVHWVTDAIQPSHPLLLPLLLALTLSQHQGLFQWTGTLHQVAKILELQLQYQSFQWIFRADFF